MCEGRFLQVCFSTKKHNRRKRLGRRAHSNDCRTSKAWSLRTCRRTIPRCVPLSRRWSGCGAGGGTPVFAAGASALSATTGAATATAPPGLRPPWGRAHGLGAARGVRGAWRGGRPSAVGGAGQPVHQGFRDGVCVAGGGRQPEDRGRIPTHRVQDGRPYRAQGRRPLGILDAVHVRRSHRDGRGRDQLREGGHTCITVAVDHKRERVVRAHDGYGKEALGPFFRQPTDERRASIRIDADDGAEWIDADDGAEWIDAGVRKHPPNAGRFLDPFRIVSRMSDALDQVRKRLRNQARCGNDKTATGATRDVRYAVLKNPEDLAERPDTALAALGDTDPRGRPYRSWQPKELPRDAPAPARRTSRGRSGTMDLPGLTQPHPRDRRTMREDPRTRGRHPRGHLTRPLQRRARGIQRQDQDHHPHGLRLPPRRQPHRHDQTPMQQPTHPPANTHPLTHENSRRL